MQGLEVDQKLGIEMRAVNIPSSMIEAQVPFGRTPKESVVVAVISEKAKHIICGVAVAVLYDMLPQFYFNIPETPELLE